MSNMQNVKYMYILTNTLNYDWQKTDPDLSSERAPE
jgi:hypothetical protein